MPKKPSYSRFNDALIFAAQLHISQVRKGTTIPYISHLLVAAATVLEIAEDDENTEDMAIAALLHDAVEDQGGKETLVKIRKEYGENVAEIVAACSDTLEKGKTPWEQKKKAFLEKLPYLSEQAQIVSLADKLHNARAILLDYKKEGEALWDRFNSNKEDILWYYCSLVKAFKKIEFTNKKAPFLVSELEQTVNRIEAAVAAKTGCI